MASSSLIDFEPIIRARLLEAQFKADQREINPEVARFFLSMGFADRDHERIRYLAERSQAGPLTAEEAGKFDSYLHVGNLLALMEAKAHSILGVSPPAPHAS